MTPWSESHLWFAAPARPITLASAFLASCTAIEPTPPAAPETTTVSSVSRATLRTAAYAVVPATNRAPACAHETFAGRGTRSPAPTTTNSAWLDLSLVNPMTSSPTATFVTPGPSSSTIPARSLPCPEGNVAGQRSANSPFRIEASPGLMPAALTRTRTLPGPGIGRSTSTTRKTSRSPYLSNLTARAIALSFIVAQRLFDFLQAPSDSPNLPVKTLLCEADRVPYLDWTRVLDGGVDTCSAL